MQHIAIYAVDVCILPYEDMYKKHLLLFGYSHTGKSILLKITNFQYHVLVLPDQDDMILYGNETYLNYIKKNFNVEHKTRITSIEVISRIPTSSFTGERNDLLLKLYYENPNDVYNIRKVIQEFKKLGNIKLNYIIHSKISQPTQFNLAKILQLQTWVTIENFKFLSNDISYCTNIHIDAFRNQIYPCEDINQLKKLIKPRKIYLRLAAYSSLSTLTSHCYPDAKIKDDVITHLAYQIENQQPKCLNLKEHFDNDEKKLLECFDLIFHSQNIHIVIFGSDELLKPNNVMEYIILRSQLNDITFSFSCIKNLPTTINILPNNLHDLNHPGIERIDVIPMLKRTIISPPMIGYTMLDVVRHKNLLNRDKKTNLYDNEDLNRLLNPNFVAPNHFTAHSNDIVKFLISNIIILSKLMNDKGFIPFILTVSKENDLDIKKVVERGQQKRVFGRIMRDFETNDLYFDEENMLKNPVTTSKKRKDSSFPDPLWRKNPDIMTLIPPDECSKLNKGNFLTDLIAKQTKFDFDIDLKTKDKKKNQKKLKATTGYGGGLVLHPLPGLYTHVRHTIATNDWAAMYPNLIRAFNLCIMREIRDSKWLTDPDVELEFIPRNDEKCDVLVKKYKGKLVKTFLPRVISGFLNLREKAREAGKDPLISDEEKAAFKVTEQALKASANSVYGFFGCLTSNIVSIQLASCVTQLGQFMQKTVRNQILLHGGICIYGDTDSCFTMYPVSFEITDPNEIKKKIKEQAEAVTKLCSDMFAPSKIIVENMKSPLLLTNKKKTYVSYEDGINKIAPKGFGLLKRDKCQFARDISLTIAEQILKKQLKSIKQTCEWFETELLKLPMKQIQLKDQMSLVPFLLSVELGFSYASEDDKLALELASLYEKESGQYPINGDRMSFVVAFFNDDRKHNKRVMPPTTFLNQNHRLDIKWYLDKQIFGCLKQILCLPIHQNLLIAMKKKIDIYIQKFVATTLFQNVDSFSNLFFSSSTKKQKIS